MEENWKPLDPDDVIAAVQGNLDVVNRSTCLSREFLAEADRAVVKRTIGVVSPRGIPVKLLREGQPWKNAQVRLRVTVDLEYFEEA